MKQLYMFLLGAVFFCPGYGQQVIYKENFDFMPGLSLSGGWTTTQSGAVGWRTSDMYNLYCSYSVIPQYRYWAKVAAISGCYGDKGGPRNNSNVFAATKVIDLSAVSNGAFLRFDSYFNGLVVNGKAEKATIEVSVNNGPWAVVYDVPKGATQDSFATWYVDLSAYKGNNNVRIGFRYSDQGENQQYGGWAIDNIELFRPAQKDLALESFSPSDTLQAYATVNNTYIHYGSIINKGLDTIHSFSIRYKRGNGYFLEDAYNIPIPPLGRFSFTHAVPDTITTQGKTDITAWVETPGDAVHKNDTVYNKIYGAYFMPKKLVAVEEGTGTWNMLAPRGHVYMNTLNSDHEACLVSIHTGDPMEHEPYISYLYALKYYSAHYFLLDRQYVDPNSFFNTFNQYNKRFGYADLEMRGVVYGDMAFVDVTVKPALDIKGDFRLILVLTENNLRGSTKEWAQVNGFAGNKMGPMGGYEMKADPVPAAEMNYNFVARAVSPDPGGDTTVPNELKYSAPYFHKLSCKLDPSWDKNKLSAIVMLLRNDDTLVLNSNRLSYFLNVAGTGSTDVQTGIYPNPANEATTLQFTGTPGSKADIIVTDINGRTLWRHTIADTQQGMNQLQIPTAGLPQGLYIVNIRTGQSSHSLKLNVLH